VTSDFRPGVEIWPFRACAMHPVINIGTVRLLWNWLWGRYHVRQNVFLVVSKFDATTDVHTMFDSCTVSHSLHNVVRVKLTDDIRSISLPIC